jgi:dipeptidyl aminopeptidase/acylaminoacyl peptidase
VSRKFVVVVAALVIAGFFCFYAMGAVFCQATLRVPRRISSTPPNATTVSISAPDKANLSAWWLRPPKSNGDCVIVLHGIGDSRAGSVGFAPLFLNEGYSVLVPDSRAHGASGGQFVTYGLLERYDVIAWVDWMKDSGCRNLYALGESLGASILIQAAAVQPVFAAIVAECSFADLRQTAEFRVRNMISRIPAPLAIPAAKMAVYSGEFYANWAYGLDLQQVSPVKAIASASTPILLIHGLDDFRTPHSNSEELARANPRDSLWLVPNAQHTGASAAAPQEFRRRVLGWFAEHTRTP